MNSYLESKIHLSELQGVMGRHLSLQLKPHIFALMTLMLTVFS